MTGLGMETILQHPLFAPVVLMVVIVAIFPLLAGYIVLVERKVLADMQVRLGPMRVGPHGLLQPLADALKLMLKEDIIPTQSDKFLFWVAPVISTFTGLTAFAVIPFSATIRVADVNVGLLIISPKFSNTNQMCRDSCAFTIAVILSVPAIITPLISASPSATS